MKESPALPSISPFTRAIDVYALSLPKSIGFHRYIYGQECASSSPIYSAISDGSPSPVNFTEDFSSCNTFAAALIPTVVGAQINFSFGYFERSACVWSVDFCGSSSPYATSTNSSFEYFSSASIALFIASIHAF